MRLSERQAVLLEALRAAFGDQTFKVAHVHKRIAGLALRERGNVDLLMALQGCVGRKMDSRRTGLLLKKIAGKRLGDLELVMDGETKRENRCEYYVRDHANPVPMPSEPKRGPWEAALAAEDLRVLPEDVDAVMNAGGYGTTRYNKALAKAEGKKERVEREERRENDRAKVFSDPELTATWRAVRCGRDGRPEFVQELAPPVVAAAAAPVVEKPAKKGWYPGCGRQPTRAELAARHHQHEGGERIGDRGLDWFVRACAARNRG